MRKILVIYAMVCALILTSNISFASEGNYEVDEEFRANNCEFYVNGFIYTEGRYTFGWRYLKTFISVNARDLVHKQGGKILAVGMMANDRQDFFWGKEVDPAYYMIKTDIIPLVPNGTGGYEPGVFYKLRNLSYFIDVKRNDGRISRLRLTNSKDDPFSWPGIYEGYPKVFVTTEAYGRGSANALQNDVENGSPLFHQRKACVKPEKEFGRW